MTVDHPDMQRAGIPPTPAAVPFSKRLHATYHISLVVLRALFRALVRFWRRDVRWGDSLQIRFDIDVVFDKEV